MSFKIIRDVKADTLTINDRNRQPNINVTEWTPIAGSVAYNVSDKQLYYADDVAWHPLAVGGTDEWHYVSDVASTTLCPDPAATGAAPSDFLVPLPAQSTEYVGPGTESKMMYLRSSSGAFRAGQVTGTQWDVANRGATSAAFGLDNIASGVQSFVGAGTLNQALATNSVVGGGKSNVVAIIATGAIIAGGESNVANSIYDAIGGGLGNVTFADYGVIAGGKSNATTASYAAIVGGEGNKANDYSFVGGGRGNQITATTTTAIGGFIGGGQGNVINEADGNADRYYNLIAGGLDNTVTNSSVCVIVGGGKNMVNVPRGPGGPGSDRGYAFIGAGENNEITQSSWSAVVAGANNKIVSAASLAEGYHFIGAGENNSIYSPNVGSGTTSGIVSGTSNQIGSSTPTDPGAIGCFIGSGQDNAIADGENCAIVCGNQNKISGGANQSIIGGGASNSAVASYAAIVGGEGNKAGDHSFVGGGTTNSALGSNCVVDGGSMNSIDGTSLAALISGGSANSIAAGVAGSASNAAILGGTGNSITALLVGGGLVDNCAIVGGSGNTISTAGSDMSRCVILGGAGITAITGQTDTAYVPRLNSGGGRQVKTAQVGVNYLLGLDDHVITISNPGPGNVDVTLPGSPVNGQEYYIKPVTIVAGDTLNGIFPNNNIIDTTGATVTSIILSSGVPIHVVWSSADTAWVQL